MYELGVFNKETEELVVDYELPEINQDQVYELVGFHLTGCCADLSEDQVQSLEKICGRSLAIDFLTNIVQIGEFADD